MKPEIAADLAKAIADLNAAAAALGLPPGWSAIRPATLADAVAAHRAAAPAVPDPAGSSVFSSTRKRRP